MNRARRKEEILGDQGDYDLFVGLLLESIQQWNVRAAAFCLVPNHYHLLIQTLEGDFIALQAAGQVGETFKWRGTGRLKSASRKS